MTLYLKHVQSVMTLIEKTNLYSDKNKSQIPMYVL